MRTLILAALLFVAGCSGVNPLGWFGSRNTGPKMAELPELRSAIPVRQLWQVNVGASGNSVFTPAVAAGSVFAAAQDGTVVRVEAGGRQLWRVAAGSRISGGVGADGSLVVVGTPEGEVIALDGATGEPRWRARVSSEVLSAPVVAGDVVIVRSADSRIFALDARDGRRRWTYQRAAPSLSVRTAVGAVVSRGLVLAGFPGGKLVALAITNGGLRWEATVALPRGATELERVTDVVGLPWVTDRETCAVAYQGRIACFALADGTVQWSRPMSSTTGVDADARLVFVSDEKGTVHAFDRSSGSSVWSQDKLARRGLTAPIALGRQIALGDVQGFIHFLGRDDGSFVGRTATDGSPILANPVRLQDGFLVQTRNGGLYAMSVQ